MNQSGRTRRRLIQLGAVSLTTAIAGCGQSETSGANREGPDYSDSTDDDTESDDDTHEPPAPALYFQAPNVDFNIYNLDTADGRPDPGDMAINHKDNTIFTITIDDEDTATATLEGTNVERDVELRLYVRDAGGSFESATQTLSATGTNSYESHEIEFDLVNVDLPTGAGSICELVAVDPTFDDDTEFILKRHQFVGVAHKNGVNWVNQDNLNHTYRVPDGEELRIHENPRGVSGTNMASKTSEPAGYVETRDDDDERTVFLVTRTPHNGELFGVSCHISHEPYNRYVNNGPSYVRYHNMDYECRYATDISHLQELGHKTHDVISQLGVQGSFNRLQVLGDMVQMIPYGGIYDDNIPPTIVLYETTGDCSNKSSLFSGIVQNTPWNQMPGFIDCEISGIGHWTIGIDANELGQGFDNDSAYFVSPTNEQKNNGYPDTEYAFFDMTYDSNIGQRTEGVEDVKLYDVGDFEHQGRTIATEKPDY